MPFLRSLFAAAALSFAGAGAAHAADSGRPNIILIVADDLGAHDLGCTGSTFHETPHLDRLASAGLRFSQAYSACTVCSPSRAALITGFAPARLRITDWIAGHDRPEAKLRPPDWAKSLSPETPTVASLLRAAGYACGHVGKWHLGGPEAAPEHHGFDFNAAGDHRGQPPSYFSPYRLPKLWDGPVGEYLTDREAEEAVRFIRHHKDRPFFLNYWPHAVHTPLQAKSNMVARYAAKARSAAGGQTHATYAAMLESLDAAVGTILKALDELRLRERTVVIFTSDNGGLVTAGAGSPTSNAPLRAGKGSHYEGGVRVPLIIHWPGVTRAGSVQDAPVIGMDIAATVLGAGGCTPTMPLDGVDLTPLLRQDGAELTPRSLFWHYPHYHPGGARPYAAIRSGPWKLVQSYETGEHELFDLSADPSEARNLAGDHPERVLGLARELFAWQGKVGAQWPMPNPAWTPASLRAPETGPVVLHARDAKVHGTVLRYEPQPFKNTLGWWSNPADWVEWRVDLARGGRYRVDFVQGCGTGSGGSEVEFQVGAHRFVTQVVETGGFQNFQRRTLGEAALEAGPLTVTVRPIRKPGVAVMDLPEMRLEPLE